MALTLRATKGSPLTQAETDANFQHCAPTSGTTQANLDLKADAADLASYARMDTEQTWTKPQRGAFTALTSSTASVAVDFDLSNNFNHTLTEDTTLAAPTNATAGQSGLIEFTQHASAPKTLAFNAFWKFPGGTVPTLTATNSAVDVLSYTVNSAGTFASCVMLNDVK